MAEAAELKLHINGNEGGDEDFYEKIEAPKFVDFRKPERRRNDEDRYWFCARVGCDLKHEEELDYEAIEKDFVLRVMAARSPNVHFQKALSKRSQSNMKCPRTAPPKSSKSRVSRLAVISSVSKKLDDSEVKTVLKSSKTPKAEVKPSFNVPKALTTPRNKRRLSNGGQFRSVRHPKTRTITASKNRVSKALVFHSPKKAENTRNELESIISMSSLCSGMKNLKITSAKKHLAGGTSKPLDIDTAKKEVKGREVKSRVFDSSYSKNYKSKETKALSSVKKKKETTRIAIHTKCPLSSDGAESKSIEKSKNRYLGQCSVLDTSRSNGQGKRENCSIGVKSQYNSESASSDGVMDLQSSSQDGKSRETDVPDPQYPRDDCKNIDKGNDFEGKTKLYVQEREEQTTVMISSKEYDPAIDEKENNGGLSENNNDGAAPDDNRKHNIENKHPNKEVFGKHDVCKTPIKVSLPLNKKSEKSSAGNGGVQGVKFYKPKPTNPKPFRFRTDERGILKDAIMERKLHQERGILKDAIMERKLHQVESFKKQENTGVICSDTSKELQATCSSKIHKQVSSQEKSINDPKSLLEKTRSPTIKPKIVKSISVASIKKEGSILTPRKLSVIPELTTVEPEHTEKPSETDESPLKKLPASSSLLREQKRSATIAKEPIFQRLHTRKSCTRKVA